MQPSGIADPVLWGYWRAILEKYDTSDLIEHGLRQPTRIEDLEWQSKADRLIGLALDAGLELFHDPDQRGWASIHVDTHWENYPIRARAFQLFLLRTYYLATGESPGAQAIRAAGIELQFSRNDEQGRRMVSVLLCAAQVRQKPSVAVSSLQ